MDEKHEIVSDLKRVASELQTPRPKRDDYLKLGNFSKHQIMRVFGSYSIACDAAGLFVETKKQKKAPPSFDRLDEAEILQPPKQILFPTELKKILVIGDAHFPFVNLNSLGAIYSIALQEKNDGRPFDAAVQVGDLFDQASFGRHPRSLDVITPENELKRGREMAEQMWKTLQGLGIEHCFQLIGNHDERIVKQTIVKYPEVASLIGEKFKELYQFEGVRTQESEREELILKTHHGEVMFLHGYRKHGDHVRFNMMHSICGHSHQPGIVYHRHREGTLIEMNVGFVANEYASALSYTKQAKISRWSQSCGIIDEYGFRVVLL